jgi:hypothetical protein
MTERIYPQFIPVDESGNIISSGGGGGDASSANQLLQLTELEEINIDLDSLTSINNKLPALIGGKIPVDITSLNVTVDNANLEISNDIGNPIPISDGGGSITIDGTITANAGTNLNTSLLALETGGNLSDIKTSINPTLSNYSSVGANVTANIKGSSGIINAISCINLNASTRYLQFFNSTGSTTGTPFLVFPVYGNSGFLEIGPNLLSLSGISLSNGITFGFSITATPYTAGSASDCILLVRFQ